jgi:ribosome-binding factor A
VGHRLLRVNERIKETLSAAIAELKDPRIGFVTVTGVETSPDLRHAKVFVSVLGTAKERDATLEALRQARGVLQGSLNTGLRLKRTPQMVFVYDETAERAQHIERLLRREEQVLGAVAPATDEGEEPEAGGGDAPEGPEGDAEEPAAGGQKDAADAADRGEAE